MVWPASMTRVDDSDDFLPRCNIMPSEFWTIRVLTPKRARFHKNALHFDSPPGQPHGRDADKNRPREARSFNGSVAMIA
jgi:hypothetical protein